MPGWRLTGCATFPWASTSSTSAEADIERVRRRYRLPAEFILFVGTLEPRKNLPRLVAAAEQVGDLPLVVVGMTGWGDQSALDGPGTLLVGFVPDEDLAPLYAAARVFALPERTGRVRVAGARGHGAGHAGRHESWHLDRGGGGRRRRARRSVRRRRHRRGPPGGGAIGTGHGRPRTGPGPQLHVAFHGRTDARRLP